MFDASLQLSEPELPSVRIFNRHVLLFYLIWYLTTYTKNNFIVYSWQTNFRNLHFLSIYKKAIESVCDFAARLANLQAANTCWFKNVKIKCNSDLNYFGKFQISTGAQKLKRNAQSIKHLTKHTLFCFGESDLLSCQQPNVGVYSWNSEFDFSNDDLTTWLTNEIFDF